MVAQKSIEAAERVFPLQDRINAYERIHRELIPGWRVEFAKTTYQMKKALPGALNGTLRDLATFILAAKANENAQCSLLSAEAIARVSHPLSRPGSEA